MSSTGALFEKLRDIVHLLRDPEKGCPWDKEQTHASLKQYLIEEAYEVLDAIDSESPKLADELGDVLLQVMLHSEIGAEAKRFSIDDVVTAISDKMIRRHPHVFGDVKVDTSTQVLQNWEKIKQGELTGTQSILDGVPKGMPSLLRAQRTGEKAARVGFEWPTLAGVRDKVTEELEEFLEWCPTDEKAISPEVRERLEDEFGDLLFALSQLSRRLKMNSEEMLHRATDKFTRRFKEVERRVGGKVSEVGLEVLDAVWNEVKIGEKK